MNFWFSRLLRWTRSLNDHSVLYRVEVVPRDRTTTLLILRWYSSRAISIQLDHLIDIIQIRYVVVSLGRYIVMWYRRFTYFGWTYVVSSSSNFIIWRSPIPLKHPRTLQLLLCVFRAHRFLPRLLRRPLLLLPLLLSMELTVITLSMEMSVTAWRSSSWIVWAVIEFLVIKVIFFITSAFKLLSRASYSIGIRTPALDSIDLGEGWVLGYFLSTTLVFDSVGVEVVETKD